MPIISSLPGLIRRKTKKVRAAERQSEEAREEAHDEAEARPAVAGPSTDVHASPATASQATSSSPNSVAGLGDGLWQQAYDRIKTRAPLLATSYERIVSGVLSRGGFVPEDDTTPPQRWLQVIRVTRESMLRLRERGVTARSLDIDQAASVIMARTPSILDEHPQAAFPWATLCLALSALQSSKSGSRDDSLAIVEIASRMNWYLALPSALGIPLGIPLFDGPNSDLPEQLIVRLYEAVLLYQINTVVVNYKNPRLTYLLLRRDDRKSQMDEIKAAEDRLQRVLQVESISQIAGRYSLLWDIEKATQDARLSQMGEARTRALQALRATDPGRTVYSLEAKMAPGSGEWLQKHSYFQQWLERERGILWITGQPGTGKTMLMARVARFLESWVAASEGRATAFFFCDISDAASSSAAGVLRNLIHHLAVQNTDLVPHVLQAYDRDGPAFADVPGKLVGVLRAMLEDPEVGETCLMIDALDECSTGASILLDLMDRTAADLGSRIRWVVSSRLGVGEYRFNMDCNAVELDLSDNEDRVSRDVEAYIVQRVTELEILGLEAEQFEELRRKILDRILSAAGSSFLYTSVLFNRLGECKTEGEILEYLERQPQTVDELYDPQIERIEGLRAEDREFCFFVLSALIVLYRPPHLAELPVLAGLGGRFAGDAATRSIIENCGSLLTVNDAHVFLIHHSLLDYLQRRFLPGGLGPIHFDIFSRSLRALGRTLNENAHNTRPESTDEHSGTLLNSLTSIHYSCIYWVDHLCAAIDSGLDHERLVSANRDVMSFLSEHLLHWFECLSRLHHLSEGVRGIGLFLKKVKAIDDSNSELTMLLADAQMVANVFFSVMYQYPEQVYGAPLVFSPPTNEVQRLFWGRRLSFIKRVSGTRSHFDGCLKILEGHTDIVRSVAFSPRDGLILSGSNDHSMILWNSTAGVRLETFQVHAGAVLSVAFVPGQPYSVASASSDKTVQIRDIENEESRTIMTSIAVFKAIAFSPTNPELASITREPAVRFFDLGSNKCILTKEDFGCPVNSIAFSPDGTAVALALNDGTIQIREASTGGISCILLGGHSSAVFAVAFSQDSRLLASASHDKRVIIWDPSARAILHTLDGHTGAVFAVAFSPDGSMLVSTSSDKTVRVWDPNTGHAIRTLEGHSDWINSVAFSPEGRLFATASHDKTVRIWDAQVISSLAKMHEDDAAPRIDDSHVGAVRAVAFSPDGTILASLSSDKTVKLWNATTGALMHTLEGHIGSVRGVAFSTDGSKLASVSNDKTVRVWVTATGKQHLQPLVGHTRRVNSAVFSADGTRLASASNDTTVRIWDAATGDCIRSLSGHVDWVTAVVLSQDGAVVAAAASDKTVCLWEAHNGSRLLRFDIYRPVTALSFSEDGQYLRAGGQWFDTVTGLPSEEALPGTPAARTCLKDDWVVRDGKKALWLPPDYRPTCSASHGDLHALGLASGRVTFLEFEWPAT